MSEKRQNKINKSKWDNIQKLGFWAIIIVSIAFWGGVLLGNYAANNAKSEIESAKTQAVQEYKADLKAGK